MKIVVLEKIKMTDEQAKRLEKLGEVEWYDDSTEEESKKRIKDADVVITDWIDPTGFILSMKTPSLLALMSTGYGWINNRDKARGKDILISNIPGYATEAVAEHIIGLVLSVARKTMVGDKNIRLGKKEKGNLEGVELKGRQMGIIGLGNIGQRVAEISDVLGMDVVTFNRNKKFGKNIKDVTLEELLLTSDVICVTCSLNDDSRNMLNKEKLKLLKKGAIITGAVDGVIVMEDLIPFLKSGQIRGVGIDIAIEVGNMACSKDLLGFDNVLFTPHIGFNTAEAKIRQADICISNILAFKNGKPINIIN